MATAKVTEYEMRLLRSMPFENMNWLVDTLRRHAWLEAEIGSNDHKHWSKLVDLRFLEVQPLPDGSALIGKIEVYGAGERIEELRAALKELNFL